MELIIGVIIGIAVASAGWVSFRVQKKDGGGNTEIEKLIAKKRENLRKIMDYLAARDDITNKEVRKLLGVAESTATRYLDELQEEGLIKQIGQTGRYTHYTK